MISCNQPCNRPRAIKDFGFSSTWTGLTLLFAGDMAAKDPERLGNRGSHRYSFAGAHKQSVKEFAVLIDPPPVLAVLEARQSAD